MYCNLFFTRLWRHKFRNWFNLSNQAVFSTCPKSRDKNLNILRTKSFLDEIKSIFHHFWRTIIEANNIFWEGESPTLRVIFWEWKIFSLEINVKTLLWKRILDYKYNTLFQKIVFVICAPLKRFLKKLPKRSIHHFNKWPIAQVSV